MFTKRKMYYSVEVRDDIDDSFIFISSYSTFAEAQTKYEELKSINNDKEYRILKVEKFIEEVS
jgi:hypothetical protein